MRPIALLMFAFAAPALAQPSVSDTNKYAWCENAGWLNWRPEGANQPVTVDLRAGWLRGQLWGENIGWISLGQGGPYLNTSADDYGVNINQQEILSGFAWGENIGWINFSAGGLANPPQPARLDRSAARLRGFAWGENIGWVNLDDAAAFVSFTGLCGASDFNADGDTGTDQDIEAFFACLAGDCCPSCWSADFDGDGDERTDADIEAFFRVLAGGSC